MRKDIRNVVFRSVPGAESHPPIVLLSKKTGVLSVNLFADRVRGQTESAVVLSACFLMEVKRVACTSKNTSIRIK